MSLTMNQSSPPRDRVAFDAWLKDFAKTRKSSAETAQVLEEAANVAADIGFHEGRARVLLELGKVYRDLTDPMKSIPVLKSVLAISSSLNDQHGRAEALVEMGRTYNLQA